MYGSSGHRIHFCYKQYNYVYIHIAYHIILKTTKAYKKNDFKFPTTRLQKSKSVHISCLESIP
ncbi:hypothetical protein HanIR_Chr09g0405871 [Helianthus annuus]|nr:hypothetical protein HanIR_Chr09g0405871 [Helianthus annuus]